MKTMKTTYAIEIDGAVWMAVAAEHIPTAVAASRRSDPGMRVWWRDGSGFACASREGGAVFDATPPADVRETLARHEVRAAA